VDDDDVGVAGNRLQREPHRVLAHAPALNDHHGRAPRHPRQGAAGALHVNLRRGDDDRDHGGMAREVADGRAHDGNAPELDELLRERTSEARTHATGGNDDRQFLCLRSLRHSLPLL
jgi:hypothetical protein